MLCFIQDEKIYFLSKMMKINAWKQTNEGTRAGTVPQNTKKKL